MKRQYLAMMISVVLVQSACSYKESAQQTHELSSANTITQDAKINEAVITETKQEAMAQLVEVEQFASAASTPKSASRMHAAKMMSKERQMMVGAAMASAPVVMSDSFTTPREERDKFEHFKDFPIKQVSTDPVSTFSLDVDTGSYALVRQFVKQGRLPASDSVRTEELINYFSYDYPKTKGEHPFAVNTELTTAPWQPDHYLLRIGVQAQDSHAEQMPAANLVFLVDVSGSMDEPNKLPLVISSLQMLTQQLRAQDKVSLVVYAGRTEVVLEPTSNKADIVAALARLQAGGSTAGASALELAYKMARKGYIKGGVNRILLATDGDFNVGITDFSTLKGMVAEKRKSGVSLTALGYGTGNYNEELMEQIADAGDCNYSYIDNKNEAKKVVQRQLSSTLATVAQDVKIQVEFNPATVKEYRLVGYENRMLKQEDFNNDKVDAGDIGAGHNVTAIYEIIPVGQQGWLNDSRYQASTKTDTTKKSEYAFVNLRYKLPNQEKSILLNQAVKAQSKSLAQANSDTRFAIAVASYAQQLKGGQYNAAMGWDQIIQLAQQSAKPDLYQMREEFIELAKIAKSLSAKKD